MKNRFYKRTEYHRRKIKEGLQKSFPNGRIAWNKGKKFSEETKRKMSLARIGRPKAKNGFSFHKGHKLNVGYKHTLEWRKLMSERMKGDKHFAWKGGVTKVNETIRKSLDYKLWREAVFKRDNYICVQCNKNKEVSGKLNAHHIKPFSLFPELRFAIDNGITLCVSCHKKTDTYMGKIWSYKKINLIVDNTS